VDKLGCTPFLRKLDTKIFLTRGSEEIFNGINVKQLEGMKTRKGMNVIKKNN
jgi:hypothetical protein